MQGNTDIAVADFDYSAAFPQFTDGVPDTFVAAAEWAHEALGPERVDWLRRLPAERRVRTDDDTLVLVCHGSPGSQTAGFDQALDPTVVIERVARTDARVIVCGHTHLPDVRDLGWKIIVNDGSAGYVFDGDPTASWALVDIVGEDVTAEIKRTEFDALAVANAISARGLPGRRLSRSHRAHGKARPMNDSNGRRVVVTGMGLLTPLGNDVDIELGEPRRRPLRHSPDRGLRPVAGLVADRRRGARLRRERRPRSQGAAPHRPLHRLRAGGGAPGAGPGRVAGPLRGRPRRADRRDPRDRPWRRRHAGGRHHGERRCAAPTASARSSSRWASRIPARARSRSTSA